VKLQIALHPCQTYLVLGRTTPIEIMGASDEGGDWGLGQRLWALGFAWRSLWAFVPGLPKPAPRLVAVAVVDGRGFALDDLELADPTGQTWQVRRGQVNLPRNLDGKLSTPIHRSTRRHWPDVRLDLSWAQIRLTRLVVDTDGGADG
jgi:hypothetical protein